MVPLGLNGVSLYRESIPADFTLGPFGNRLRMDRFVFPADVSRLLVRGEADRIRRWADVRRYLEILSCVGCSRCRDSPDSRGDTLIGSSFWSRRRTRADGSSFSCILRVVSRWGDYAPQR